MIKDKQTTIAYHCPNCGLSILSSVNIFAMSENMLKLKCSCKGSELVMQITKDKKIRISVPCIICPTPHAYTLSSNSFFNRDIFVLTCTLTGMEICFIGAKDNVLQAIKHSEDELIKLFNAEMLNESESDLQYDVFFDNEEEDKPDEDFFLDGSELLSAGFFNGIGEDTSKSDPVFIGKEADHSHDIAHYVNNGEQVFSLYSMKNNDKSNVLTKEKDNVPLFYNENVTERLIYRLYDFIKAGKVACACEKPDIKLIVEYSEVCLSCAECGDKRRFSSKTIDDFNYIDDIDMICLD